MGLLNRLRQIVSSSPSTEATGEPQFTPDPGEPEWSRRDRKRHLELIAESPRTEHFRVVGADDSRTTKMSYWIRGQIPPDGVTHDTLTDILDRAVELAQEGAFKEDGELSDAKGQSTRLEEDFSRSGYEFHPKARDTVERVVE